MGLTGGVEPKIIMRVMGARDVEEPWVNSGKNAEENREGTVTDECRRS